ncbi:hypothetical protein D1222_01860 [Henriciella algicola]|uniref:Uncharacterized protein n=1 Tax=Henriciella algicola TaxID=1608422 RepID=A0A399RMF2_9PROT|nr:hypothetical protein D1222_01860 [Henriciella algicola]
MTIARPSGWALVNQASKRSWPFGVDPSRGRVTAGSDVRRCFEAAPEIVVTTGLCPEADFLF